MRITSIGGGPGGLYAAILLKASDPSRHVVVHERNAPDDTFGWGVVFSAATLSELEDADEPTYGALMQECARWDPVDIIFRGTRIRVRGNRFAAISRKRLLNILQVRCAELGVQLQFGSEIADPRTVAEGSDLVLAADGVNSWTRTAFEEQFQPRMVREGGKFIWLGTTLPLDAFTFVFKECEFGRFQAHSYPFDQRTSTFIVECDVRSWSRAGLDAVDASALAPGENDEHALRFCSELFAAELRGHPLLGNNSKWLDWYTVSNQHWHHDNVVLLGDAAHTAHFSIGSGTKLAMEDAIALARAIDDNTDVPTALRDYESARKPAVERVQEAARESLAWFSRYDRYLHFDAPTFAYSLMTRSTRVHYENLRLRDVAFVSTYDRWYAERSGMQVLGAPVLAPPQPAWTPVRVGQLELANRLALTCEPGVPSVDGVPTTAAMADLRDLGMAGAGLLLVEGFAVSAGGRITPQSPGLYGDAHEAALRELAEVVHRAGTTRLGVQLLHAGARGATRARRHGADRPLREGAWPLVAASPRPYTPRSQVPMALDREGMDQVRDSFVQAARRAVAAGVDLVELHLAHGYLLGGFLSPLTNERDDEYGGAPERRLAFPLEVARAVREVVPASVALTACLGASDLRRGGVGQDEVVAAARALFDAGVVLFNVVAGHTTAQFTPSYGTAYYAPWADLVRNRARVPTMASGFVPTPVEANHVLAAGNADLVVLGRPLLPAEAWAVDEGPQARKDREP